VRFGLGSVRRMPRFCLKHQTRRLSFSMISPEHGHVWVCISEDDVVSDDFLN
jgi:hypothetical protein